MWYETNFVLFNQHESNLKPDSVMTFFELKGSPDIFPILKEW